MAHYTDDQIDHYLEVGGKTRPAYAIINQLVEENKALKSDGSYMARIMVIDKIGHDALVESHNALEASLAEANALLDEMTS